MFHVVLNKIGSLLLNSLWRRELSSEAVRAFATVPKASSDFSVARPTECVCICSFIS